MDIFTHGLASYAITRAIFPRAPRNVVIGAVIAGVAPDIDSLAVFAGPSAFLQWNRTYMHSILIGILIAMAVSVAVASLSRSSHNTAPPLKAFFPPLLLAVALHLAMDLCQSAGLELLWPFRATRFSADWAAHLDLWILTILLAGILLPLLARLVTEEIGAKSKSPRGRLGAALALVAMFFYIGARAILHKGAIAEMQSVTYRGESPRKVAAIAESSSPFLWHGIVETERALHDVEVDVSPNASFNPNLAFTSYKPEPSPALEAARNTAAARRFLAAARFPKASIEKTRTGYHVEIHDFPFRQDSRAGRKVMAVIDTDDNAKIIDQQIAWDPASKENWWTNNSAPSYVGARFSASLFDLAPQPENSSLLALYRFRVMPVLQNHAR